MEKRTETGLVMGHAYGVTAVKKVTSTFYLMVIGYSWSSSSFKMLFTMMVKNTSKEKYNCFSHDVVTSDSVDCDVSTQYCQSSSGNEVEQINVQIHMLLCSVAIGWDSTAVISAFYGSGSLWSVAALLSCCYVF